MNKKFRKEMLLIATAVVLFFGSCIVVAQRMQHQALHNSLHKQQQSVTQSASLELETYIDSLIKGLQTITLNEDINSGSPATCNTVIGEAQSYLPSGADSLSRMSSGGDFDCSSASASVGYYGPNLPHLKEILEDVDHKPVVGRLAKAATSDSHFVSVHVPRFDNQGEFLGTIGSATFFDNINAELLDPKSNKSHYSFYVIDDDMTIMSSDNRANIGKKFDDELRNARLSPLIDTSFSLTSPNNLPGVAVSSIEPVEGRTWHVVSVQDTLPETNITIFGKSFSAAYLLLILMLFTALCTLIALQWRANKYIPKN